MHRLTIAVVVAAMAIPPSASGADLPAANGVLMTDTGHPIVGYPVIIEGQAGQFVAVTSADGSYSVEGLPGGLYTAAPAGDLTQKKTFSVRIGPKDTGLLERLFGSAPAQPTAAPSSIPTIHLKTGAGN